MRRFTSTNGLECFYDGSFPELVDSILDMLLAVEFVDVKLQDTNHVTGFVFNTAELNIQTTSPPAACDGDIFFIKARFNLPNDSNDCCGDLITFVKLSDSNKFQLLDWQFAQNEDKRSGFVVVKLRRRLDGSGSSNSVHMSVGGTHHDGSGYRGQGTVHLKC